MSDKNRRPLSCKQPEYRYWNDFKSNNMTQIDRLLQYANSQIGKGERGKNNSGPYIEFLSNGKTGNWCATFVSTCFEQVNICPDMPARNRRGAKALVKYIANDLTSGMWIAKPRRINAPIIITSPKPGDVIAWHRTPGADGWRDWRGHVELIESYNHNTGVLITIAGNVGRFPAKVKRRHHKNWKYRLFGIARLGVLHGSKF